MRFRAVMNVPERTTISGLRDVEEMLRGHGFVTVNLREGQCGRVTFEFDSESAAASSGYMLELVVTVASVALAGGGRLPVEEPRLRQALAAGLGVAETWHEVVEELRAAGWSVPHESLVRVS
jgi:hypothetical protein